MSAALENTSLPSNYCSNFKEPNHFPGTLGIVVTDVSLMMSILAMIVNSMTLAILKRDTAKTTTRFLLMALAVEDLILVPLIVIYYISGHYYQRYDWGWLNFFRLLDSPVQFLINWIKMVEIYTVVLVSVDRYIAIRFPLKAFSICRVANAMRGLLVIVVITFILKLPNLIVLYEVTSWVKYCNWAVKSTMVFEDSASFRLIYQQITDQIFSYIIPLLSLIILNSCLIFRIRKASSQRSQLNEGESLVLKEAARRDGQLKRANTQAGKTATSSQSSSSANQKRGITLTLIGVISIFIICETPTSMVFLYDMYCLLLSDNREDSNFYLLIYPFALIFMLLNACSNFFVYILIGTKFRRLFLSMFCSCIQSADTRLEGSTNYVNRTSTSRNSAIKAPTIRITAASDAGGYSTNGLGNRQPIQV